MSVIYLVLGPSIMVENVLMYFCTENKAFLVEIDIFSFYSIKGIDGFHFCFVGLIIQKRCKAEQKKDDFYFLKINLACVSFFLSCAIMNLKPEKRLFTCREGQKEKGRVKGANYQEKSLDKIPHFPFHHYILRHRCEQPTL